MCVCPQSHCLVVATFSSRDTQNQSEHYLTPQPTKSIEGLRRLETGQNKKNCLIKRSKAKQSKAKQSEAGKQNEPPPPPQQQPSESQSHKHTHT